MNRWMRKLHRWGGVLIAVPLLLVILTGLMLQLKKEIPWIQPRTQKGSSNGLVLSWSKILQVAKSVQQAEVDSWENIDRLDVRPEKGLIKIRCKNNWELQIDAANGEVLSSSYRRSDLIESLHDGSFFSDFVKLYVFSANGLVLLGLLLSGMWLWYLPIKAKRRKKRRLTTRQETDTYA